MSNKSSLKCSNIRTQKGKSLYFTHHLTNYRCLRREGYYGLRENFTQKIREDRIPTTSKEVGNLDHPEYLENWLSYTVFPLTQDRDPKFSRTSKVRERYLGVR